MRRVAVLLNRNAQRATPRRILWLRQCAGAEHVYLTNSEDEARAAAAAVADYDAVCVGGGDGTFMRLVADLVALAPPRFPALLPLRLGSGNAIADVAGASPATRRGLMRDVARAAGDEPAAPLKLLEVDGRITHFTGVGLDANWADDYDRTVRTGLFRTPFAPVFRGFLGYFVTATMRTVPKLIAHPRTAVRLVALGPVQPLDPDGRPDGAAIPDGATIHEGDATLAAAATVVPYSRGMPFFPFAEQVNGFQLRVLSAGALHLIFNLPRAFSGRYRNRETLQDYAATGVRVELPTPACFHLGGDVQEPATSFTVKLSRHVVPMLRRPAA